MTETRWWDRTEGRRGKRRREAPQRDGVHGDRGH